MASQVKRRRERKAELVIKVKLIKVSKMKLRMLLIRGESKIRRCIRMLRAMMKLKMKRKRSRKLKMKK